MPSIIDSIRAEFMRYKTLAENAIEQVDDRGLVAASGPEDNSIAVICWHMAGNLRSRFTDFLTSDGEKPWRKRDEEFEPRTVGRDELLRKWEQGWSVLTAALNGLTDDNLHRTVVIRGQSMPVHEALHRALAHHAYHAGQIVYIAKSQLGANWNCLSIPRGESDRYNANPSSYTAPRKP
jgi:uncharacterized damage-inducible protein DinB